MNWWPFRRSSTSIRLEVSVFVEQDGAAYHAFNPALTGLHADGGTPEAAVQAFAAVLPAYVESLARHGDPLPIGTTVLRDDTLPVIPIGAIMRHVTLPWPS